MRKAFLFLCLIAFISCHFIQECDRDHDHTQDYGSNPNYDRYDGRLNDQYDKTSGYYSSGKIYYGDVSSNVKLEAGQVNLLADNGKYLARCQQCGDAKYIDTAGVHITDPSLPWAIWTIEIVGNKVAFKADSGKYLARCENCWNKATYKDNAFVHVADLENKPWALWTPVYMGGRKWAFQSDVGYYLARC